MSALDFTPSAVAAPRPGRVLRHAALEARLILRNGEQLLLALVIPLALVAGQAAFGPALGISAKTFVPSVIALGAWSTGFTTVAITTAFERRYGVLERLAATPLRPTDLLLGKAIAMAAIAAGQAAVIALAGLAAGWRPQPLGVQVLVVLATVVLALTCFTALALALSGRGSAELTLGLANLIYLVGAAAGILIPPDAFSGWVAVVLSALPTTALAEALRDASTGQFDPTPVGITLLWAVAALAVARKAFRWTS